MHNLKNKKWLTGIFSNLLLTTGFCLMTPTWAENNQTQALKEQQQQLRELLDRIGKSQDLRAEQRAMIKKLEKQMSCNWDLIQNYENCEKTHIGNLESHVSCKQEAKEKAIKCLSSADK